MKFVDVKNDIAFRKMFGNEKKTNILISFLNAVLKLEGDQRIEEVTIINPYLLPRVAGENASVIAIRAKDKKVRQFVIEMQMADVDGFDKRVQYYASKDYSTQIDRGEQYPLLKPTYFIGILDFDFFESAEYLSNHLILNEKTYEHKLKDIQFTFIELRKFDKKADEMETLTDKWIFFIKNAEKLEVIPENTDDEGLVEAYKDADKHSWKKEELIAYDNASIAEQDERGRLIAAEKKGKTEGKLEEKEGVVERCLEENMSPEFISKIVNLPVSEVKQMIEKIKKRK
ncbi:MAG: Rpn family recombination-promoting nuclease/putative transposase [Sphingobacteriales bacterium]|nr:MAG: Rpn family recombination-promoting nuclease/putative transposase [Sphingobacteriales bacterium]